MIHIPTIFFVVILSVFCGGAFYSYYPIWPDIKFIVVYVAHMLNAINPSLLIVEYYVKPSVEQISTNRLYRVLRYHEKYSLLLIPVFVATMIMIAFYELFETYVVISFLSFQILWTISLLRVK